MTRHRFATWAAWVSTVAFVALGAVQGSAAEAATDYTPEQILAKYGPAVVSISGKVEGVGASGSGFLVSADGQIVTNYHVVRSLYPAQVKLANGDVYDDISVVAYDSRRDLAVIKINGFHLPVAELGDSDETKSGARVIVIGNPRGFENTVSDGLFSGARESGAGFQLCQMSAPISPGSSGGPVFDSQGRVIGVATLSVVSGQNLNFFVPINYARGLVGGAVRYKLKDLPQEKLGLEAAAFSGPATGVETLKLLIEAVTTYYRALDCSIEGEDKSRVAGVWGRSRENFSPAQVDVLFSDSLALFDQAEEQAVQAAAGEGPAASLAMRVAVTIAKVGDAHDDMVQTFIDPPLSWAAVLQNCNAISRAAQAEFSKEIEELKKIVADTAPDLASGPLAVFDPDARPKPGEGFIGIRFPSVGREAHVVHVHPKTPADKARLRPGDVILGVEGGPSFADRVEVNQYLRARPNQTVVLRVRRENKEIKLRITPIPFVPDDWK